jgi:hypothetical protein
LQVLYGGASYQEIIACDRFKGLGLEVKVMFLIASASPDENDRIPPNDGCKGGVPRLVWDWAEAFSVASDSCFMYTAGSGSEAPSCVEYLLNSGPKRQYCEHKYAQPLAPCIRTRHPPSPG